VPLNLCSVKEFLKPNRKKTSLAITLFGMPFFFDYTCNILSVDLTCVLFAVVQFVWIGILLATLTMLVIMITGVERMSISLVIFGLVLDIFVNYLISCIIVWIYDKFRKK